MTTSPHGLRCLIVDYGGVMTNPVQEIFSAWADADGLERAEIKAVLAGMLGDEAADGPLHGLERGEVSVAEFEQRLAAGLRRADGGEIAAAGLLTRAFAKMRVAPGMVTVVRRAKDQGIRTGLLSNSWGLNYDRSGWDDLFDSLVISGEVGLRKPEPAIYRLAAERLGAAARGVRLRRRSRGERPWCGGRGHGRRPPPVAGGHDRGARNAARRSAGPGGPTGRALTAEPPSVATTRLAGEAQTLTIGPSRDTMKVWPGSRARPRRWRCVISDRLSPLDVSFLYIEEPTTPMHVGGVAVFQPPETGLDYERLAHLVRQRIVLRAAIPAEDPEGAGRPRQTRLGRRRQLRPQLPRSTVRAAPPGQRRATRRVGRAADVAPARPGPTALGGLPGGGPGRRPGRDHHQDPSRAGRRCERGGPDSGDLRHVG